MPTLDELKQEWATAALSSPPSQRVDHAQLQAITQAQSARHITQAVRYFWGSLTLQIIVYALLSHVCIRFGRVPLVLGLSVGGALLHLPFTVMLMRHFKRIARASPAPLEASFSLQARIQQQYNSLRAFYRFKRGYEYGLIPLSTALGVWLIFQLYVPGGVADHFLGAALLYLLSLLSCGWAIQRENRLHFQQPLQSLKDLLEEFSH
jgi:hypothetical protein